MRFHALAADYDGTLAQHGVVDEPTLAALERLRGTGRKLILVTGRELDELLRIFPQIELFDRVVAENGALLYTPQGGEVKILGEAPPAGFADELRRRGVTDLSLGRVIVATWRPHEMAVLGAIRDLGLELQVIFNKDAVMVLPAGVNKATGLAAALTELTLSPHEVVGIGDAENDHAFLAACACGVAVDNALPAIKDRVDFVTHGDHGAGVAELISLLIDEDLATIDDRLSRHHLLLGHTLDSQELRLPPYGLNLLIAGPSGSGKSTAAAALLERLTDNKYQVCIIDPEGDYEGLEDALSLGESNRPPVIDEILRLLEDPANNLVVNLIGLPLADRPPFFLGLLPHLLDMRARTGRPHWLLVDEAHHLLPASWEPGRQVFPRALKSAVFITVHPDQVTPDALASIDMLVAVGPTPQETIDQFCKGVGEDPPRIAPGECEEPGERRSRVVFWQRREGERPQSVCIEPSRAEHHRHIRKYAEGELPPERSFYFRGPEGKLNLRAQNLFLFLQLAEGVDDETWLFHLKQQDYSKWFRERIKDEDLANDAAEIETSDSDAARSRQRIKEIIGKRYTLPASSPLPMPGTDAAPTRQKDNI